MQIGELAEKTGLSLRTIRHYDEVGLLKPSARSEGGFRLYTKEDLARLILIRRMKPLGFSLEDMNELLNIVETLRLQRPAGEDSEVRTALKSFVTDAEARREKLREQLSMADEFLDLLNQA
ncbi:MAG: MerR family transcriptional regulator [Homoserinimonas sp.]|nr:MerR family transcriptional regulator [Homoserinimonas sp.]